MDFSSRERAKKKTDRPPSRPVRCMSYDGIDLADGEMTRRGLDTENSSKYGKRQVLSQCLALLRRRRIISLQIIMAMFVVWILLRPITKPNVVTIANNDSAHPTSPGATTPPYRSPGLTKLLSNTDQSNSRTKGLLRVLSETKIPDFLMVHRGGSLPLGATSCIVTAYFRVKSKHTRDEYEKDWMQNFLSLEDCMVIFGEIDMVETMIKARAHRPTVILSMKLDHLPISQYIGPGHETPEAFWQQQLEIDPEQKLHKSYQLFWIWLSKTWFVVVASLCQEELFKSNHLQTFVWADIGSFRNGNYSRKRLIKYPESLLKPNDEKTTVWMAHHKPNPPKDPYWDQKLKRTEKHHFYHSGSLGVASTVAAWVNYYIHFVETFDQYAVRGLFVGEDQCILQTTCLLHPETCAYLPFNQVIDNHYFGLRYALHFGNQKKKFNLWYPPPVS